MAQSSFAQSPAAESPAAQSDSTQQTAYQSGFGNEFATEAHAGALPQGQNAPQHAPLGLYTEQISGTSFTTPRALNRRTWSYRIRPSVMHEPYAEYARETRYCAAAPSTKCPRRPTRCAGILCPSRQRRPTSWMDS